MLYGTDALGGAIVIRDRWRSEPGFEMSSDSAAGSFGTVQETVGALGQLGPWDFAGGVHTLKTDGHRAGPAVVISLANLESATASPAR